ncbi:tetratricopeptide repeat protein [Armatimonas sp.]|uniref:tetratricopeptide repeat protein n=1 Tax=Armatimonas sp. TaxID=1872638 RepID=UPI00286D5F9B|nr:tetratricopeptide repeat protein [Armatimonas sp.]
MSREKEPAVVTVTFLCTDIVGSTRLWQESGALMRERLAWHDARVHELALRFGGDVFKARGDGFFVAFRTVLAARDMAVALQQALFQEFGEAFAIRTVLSTGEAQHRDGDYFGLALSRAARVLELSHGTQLVFTETTARLIEEAEPAAAVQLKDLGAQQLRSLERPERLFQLIVSGLPSEFPPFASASLPPHNLPRTLTTFIGREKECAEVERLLSQTRLLTVLGAGGNGKTRLALKVGDELLTEYRGGVWFVDLAPVADATLFPRAVAAALRVREDAGADLMETLLAHLAPRKLLLILDNCEHLVVVAACFTQQILVHCPEVTILATSREALGLTGEVAWPLPGLALPSESITQPAKLLRYEAIQLFTERATAISPSFRLTTDNGASVARICRRLDGIPLAMELAAAWMSALSPEQIDQHLLDEGFLESVDPTAPERQRTLQGTMDWSHSLLTVPEQTLWRRISVFAGSFTQEAAGFVCTDDLLPAHTALRGLRGLVRKSILLHDNTSPNRFRLLETVHEYGLEKLKEADELSTFRLRHLEHFTALAEEAEPHLRGPEQKAWLDRLEIENPNLRVALAKPEPENGELALRLASAIFWFWRVRHYGNEGRFFLSRYLDPSISTSPLIRARGLRALGILAMENGELDIAEKSLLESRKLFLQGDQLNYAHTLSVNLGILAAQRGDTVSARLAFEQAIEYYRDQKDTSRLAMLLTNLGTISLREKNIQEAQLLFEESLMLHSEVGDETGKISILNNLGIIYNKQKSYKKAKNAFFQSIKISIDNDIRSQHSERLLIMTEMLHQTSPLIPLFASILGKIHSLITSGDAPLEGAGHKSGEVAG